MPDTDRIFALLQLARLQLEFSAAQSAGNVRLAAGLGHLIEHRRRELYDNEKDDSDEI